MIITIILTITAVILLVLNRYLYPTPGAAQISKEVKVQAKKYNLSTNTSLIRKTWGLVLDRDRSQLLYVSIKSQQTESILFDLSEIDCCDVLETYSKSRLFFSNRQEHSKEYIESILLIINKRDESNYHIPFFSYGKDKLSEMKMFFCQARRWQRMLQQ